MTASALLDHLNLAGVVLDLMPGGNIHFKASTGVLKPDLKDAIRRHKPELVANRASRHLSRNRSPT